MSIFTLTLGLVVLLVVYAFLIDLLFKLIKRKYEE